MRRPPSATETTSKNTTQTVTTRTGCTTSTRTIMGCTTLMLYSTGCSTVASAGPGQTGDRRTGARVILRFYLT